MMRQWRGVTFVCAGVLLACTACNTGALDDLAQAASKSTADEAAARALVKREANALGRSGDDVAEDWLEKFKGAAPAYDEIDASVRAATCDVVTGWAGALVTPDPEDDQTVAMRVASAIANLNSSVSAQNLARELSAALQHWQQGEPIYMTVLLLQTGLCGAAD